tara:strand:+ start:289 stop:765 length:477 start_codon:yes stop_codon:yes gene_type:complete
MEISKTLLLTFTFFSLLATLELSAQENTVASGGQATGSGGTVNYSVGQVVYSTNIGTNGSVSQGVQQPYAVSTTVGINETSIQLNAYPNPTTNNLTLTTDDSESLSYQLFNIQGAEISSKTLNSKTSNISLEGHPPATYFLKVIKNNEVIKAFKIIKN